MSVERRKNRRSNLAAKVAQFAIAYALVVLWASPILADPPPHVETLAGQPKTQAGWRDFTDGLVRQGNRAEAIRLLGDYSKRVKGVQRRWALERIRIISRLFAKSSSQQIFQDGLNLLALKQVRQAREKFLEASNSSKEEKDNAEILVRIGQTFLLEGQNEQALSYFQQAKQACPLDSEINFWLGRAYFLNRKFSEAYAEQNSAYADMHGSVTAPLWMAETLVQSGDLTAALHLLDQDHLLWPRHLPSLILATQIRVGSRVNEKRVLTSAVKKLKDGLKRRELQVAKEKSENLDPQTEPSDIFGLDALMRQGEEAELQEVRKLIAQFDAASVTPPDPR